MFLTVFNSLPLGEVLTTVLYQMQQSNPFKKADNSGPLSDARHVH